MVFYGVQLRPALKTIPYGDGVTVSNSFRAFRSVVIRAIYKIELFITSMVTDRIGRNEVLSSIYYMYHNFREKKRSQVIKKNRNFALKD